MVSLERLQPFPLGTGCRCRLGPDSIAPINCQFGLARHGDGFTVPGRRTVVGLVRIVSAKMLPATGRRESANRLSAKENCVFRDAGFSSILCAARKSDRFERGRLPERNRIQAVGASRSSAFGASSAMPSDSSDRCVSSGSSIPSNCAPKPARTSWSNSISRFR